MTAAPPRLSRGRWVAPLLIVFVGAIAYSNSLNNSFIYDDLGGIESNPQIRSLVPGRYSSPIPTSLSGRPMLAFSFAVDYAIGGVTVEIYHLTNLVIHLLAGLLLYAILQRTLLCQRYWSHGIAGSATWLAGITAALWVAHPLTTAAVTYTIQRAESLASLFLLASIYCVIRAAGGSKWWGLGAVAMSGLGMATKEIAAAAPLLAILYDRTFLAGSFKAALKQRWKIYLGMIAMWGFVLRAYFIDRHEGTIGIGVWISPIAYARTELNVIAHYLRLAFWPTDLCLDYYDWPVARDWSHVSVQGWLVAAILIGTAVALWRKPWLGFLGAWFFLILAPSSSMIPVAGEAAADQRMYLPLAALICVVVVGGWAVLSGRRLMLRTAEFAVGLVIVLLVRMTMERNTQYATLLSIWTDTVAKRPYNRRARSNLALAWAQKSLDYAPGSEGALWAARQAQEECQIILSQDPKYRLNFIAVGEALEQSGDPAAAEDFYTRTLKSNPELAGYVMLERGGLRMRRKNWAGAVADFLAAVRALPGSIDAHYSLGVLYQQSGNRAAAEAELARVVAMAPDYKDAAKRLAEVRKPAAGVR